MQIKEKTMPQAQIKEGQRVPQVTFRVREDNQWKSVTTDELFGGKTVQHFEASEVIARLVDIWLEGMKPRPTLRATKALKSRRPRTAEKVAR